MTLKSIEKLRDWANNYLRGGQSMEAFDALYDEIEREVGERQRNYEFLQRTYDAAIADRNANWMKQPVDADGVPIRVGDIVTDGTYKRKVWKIEVFNHVIDGAITSMIILDSGASVLPETVRIYRKPTVEDVMHDYANAYMQIDGQNTDEIDAEYIDKLREAVRGE